MRKHLFSCTVATVLAGALLIYLAGCQGDEKKYMAAADPAKPPPVPHMWMPDGNSKQDEKHYADSLPMLTAQLGSAETDSVVYPIKVFQQMIAAFDTMPHVGFVDICPVADTVNRKLTVLYIPEDSDCNPLGYYLLPPNATSWPQRGDTLTAVQYQDWVDAYENTAAKWLRSSLDPSDPDNYVNGNTLTGMPNTLHISHYIGDLDELSAELSYQTRNLSNPVTGIGAFFALKPPNTPGAEFGPSNRLYIIFEFVTDDANGKHPKFFIKTTGRQIQHSDPPQPGVCYVTAPLSVMDSKHPRTKPEKDTSFHKQGSNNGQLCPPTCIP
ncbi:MAG TPA: hypothetical protein VLD19_07265 [Chitinophagaceae bacterium]|nr:hypothetical protein [Chitinophagaceae bacterium]